MRNQIGVENDVLSNGEKSKEKIEREGLSDIGGGLWVRC
jgi:hypothetical protein